MTGKANKRNGEAGRSGAATGTGSGAGGRIAWFHCFSGIAGDMALGSLVDAGADPGELGRMLDRLPIDGWSLGFEPVLRNGIAATRAVVKVRDDAVVRTFPHVMGILEEARMPDRVRERAVAAFSFGAGPRFTASRLVPPPARPLRGPLKSAAAPFGSTAACLEPPRLPSLGRTATVHRQPAPGGGS